MFSIVVVNIKLAESFTIINLWSKVTDPETDLINQ